MALSDYDAEAETLVREGLREADPEVRIRAAMAAAHLQWPELGDAVLEALERETDPRNQRLLEVVARSYS
jgi:hypothetical protein